MYTNDDDTLPDLQPIENERTQEDDAQYVEISYDKPTFMDGNVTVPDAGMEFLHKEPAQVLKFSPLNSVSREECGPLVNIVECSIIEYTNVGADLIRKLRNVHNVKGDGNCYFRCISYTLSSCEDYYDNMREHDECECISWFPGQLCALIPDKDEPENGLKYIKRRATEVKILAIAKCLGETYLHTTGTNGNITHT